MKKIFTINLLSIILLLQQANAQSCYCGVGIYNYSATKVSGTTSIKVVWTSSSESVDGVSYNIEKSNDGANFYLIGTVNYSHAPGNANYSFTDNCGRPSTSINTVYYRVVSLDDAGHSRTSVIATTDVSTSSVGTCYSCSSLSISGPSELCSSSLYSIGYTSAPVTSYSLSNSNATLSSYLLTNNVNVSTNLNGLSTTLSIAVSGCPTPFTKVINLGKPGGTISNTSSNCYNSYTIKGYAVPFVSGVTYTWSVNNGAELANPNGSSNMGIYFNHSGSYTINVSVSNSCGSQLLMPYSQSVTLPCSGFMITTSPNPATNKVILNVIENKLADEQNYTTNHNYTIKLFDVNHQLKLSLKSYNNLRNIPLNVSSLQGGLYYLEVQNGIDVVKHTILIKK